jgi:hypothetical protein
VVASPGAASGAPSSAVCKIGARNAGASIYPRTGGDPLARLVPNPLHDLTHPMGRLEQSMVRLETSIAGLHKEMEPIRVLPEVLAALERMEGLMERLVAAAEADAVS